MLVTPHMRQNTPESLGNERVKAFSVIASILIVYLLLAYGAYSVFTSQIASGNDFYPRWRGTRALIMEGRDPYSKEVTLEIQEGVYGRPARADEDQVAFAYPLYVSFLLLPFSFFSYPYAQALWLSTLICLSSGAVILILRTVDWQPAPAALITLSMWCLFFYPTARSLVLGQLSILILALVALALWAIEQGWDFLAGGSLALATIKPQMVFLLIPFLLLSSLTRRRYRVLLGFLAGMGILLLLSWLALPTWMRSFVTNLGQYQAYTTLYRGGRSPLGVLADYLLPPHLSSTATLLISLLLLGYLISEWVRVFTPHGSTFRALLLTIIATLLIPAETGTSNQVLLLLPVVYWLSQSSKKPWPAVSLFGVLLVGPWLLFLLTVQGNLEHPIMSPVLPLVTLATLGWSRKETHG